jgi:glycerophosphoryl diester phosphodiesterase
MSLLNIAHRGASAYEHENTLASIEKAVELGADAVEFDLRRTTDGVIVLWHAHHRRGNRIMAR